MNTRWPARRRALVVATLLVASFPLLAQSNRASAQWVVRRNAAADAWFHALAMIGVDGPGPLAFYSADYRSAVLQQKLQRRARPTLLDRNAPALRRSIAEDSAFEVLHFLPLYVGARDPAELIAVVRSVARGGPPPDANGEIVAALRSLLRSDAERSALSLLADAVEDEWRGFLQPSRASTARADDAVVARLDMSWSARFAPALDGFLARSDMTRGEIWIVPSVGAEGRIASTSLRGRRTIVVVGLNAEAELPNAPLLAAVRELCFPLVTAMMIARARDAKSTVGEAARESSSAASACGASLLDQGAPLLAGDFRRMYAVPQARVIRPH